MRTLRVQDHKWTTLVKTIYLAWHGVLKINENPIIENSNIPFNGELKMGLNLIQERCISCEQKNVCNICKVIFS